MSDNVSEASKPANGGGGFVDAVASALASRRHRTHWAQPGLTVPAIQRVLRGTYPDVQAPQVLEALTALGAVETTGKSGEDTGVSFWSLPPGSKVGKCSHCGAEDVEVLAWRQPGAKETAICADCAG